MTDHPISPPPELVEQWRREPEYAYDTQPKTMVTMTTDRLMLLSKKSAQYGADQELEACCQALYSRYVNTGLLPATAATVSQEMRDWLRTTRRPKPLSLKEQALHELGDAYDKGEIDDTTYDTIRKALEALPND